MIHELVSAAAPGLAAAAAGRDGQGDTERVQNERNDPISLF